MAAEDNLATIRDAEPVGPVRMESRRQLDVTH